MTSQNSSTPLMFAVRGGHRELCQALIRENADVEASNKVRRPVEITASRMHSVRIHSWWLKADSEAGTSNR